MRVKLKRPHVRDIFNLFSQQRTGTVTKCDEGGSQTIPGVAEIESEFELETEHGAGPTTTPSTTITTSYKHLGIYPPDQHSVASSQDSVPQITVLDPDGNPRKIATSTHNFLAPESNLTVPLGLGRDDSGSWPGCINSPDAVQKSVNMVLMQALQPDGELVSGLVNQIVAALVPVLDERIKLALDPKASHSESNRVRKLEKLDSILEEPEPLSRLDALLDRGSEISNTTLQKVKGPEPPSPAIFRAGSLTRTPAFRPPLREKSGRDFDSPRTPASPFKTPHKYPGNLPTPESRNSPGRLITDGHVNTDANVTPTRAPLSGKPLSGAAIESFLMAPLMSTSEDLASSSDDSSLLWTTVPQASSSSDGEYRTVLDTPEMLTSGQRLNVSILPEVATKLTAAEPAVFAPGGLLLSPLQLPTQQEAVLDPTSSSRLSLSSSHPSKHFTTQEHRIGLLFDNPLLKDPAIVDIGPPLVGEHPAPADDETKAMRHFTGYVGAPIENSDEEGTSASSTSSSPSTAPGSEHREERPLGLRSLKEFLGDDEDNYFLEWIGGGGSGDVYRASHKKTPERRFAFKLVPIYLERTRRVAVLEARALLKITAANMYSDGARHVLRIFSRPEALTTGHSVFKMPYYKNTLHEYAQMQILHRGSLLFVVAEVTKGLQYLHSTGIVHLDLKPANIFIDDEGHCVIGDFSGSYTGPLPKLAKKHLSTMTPEYMAPEMTIGHSYLTSAKFDGKADIWSLGVTIYLLICGYRAVKSLREKINADFSDYDEIGLDKDTMVRLMNLAKCSGTVQKLVLEMCQMDQNLRWNTTMIQRYLEERNHWKWDGASPLLPYCIDPIYPRLDCFGRGMEPPKGLQPDALRACCEAYMKEVYPA